MKPARWKPERIAVAAVLRSVGVPWRNVEKSMSLGTGSEGGGGGVIDGAHWYFEVVLGDGCGHCRSGGGVVGVRHDDGGVWGCG